MASSEPQGQPAAPDSWQAHAEQLERDSRRARLIGRGFAAAAVIAIIGWSLAEPAFAMRAQVALDLAIGLFLAVGAVAVTTNATAAHGRAERAKLRQVEDMARRDELSGLHNVRYLRERLQAETIEAQRSGGPFSLVLFDLDNFKDINDRLGHIAGDRVLASIGAAIRTQVNGNGVAARQGGDEFALLLPGADRDAARATAATVADVIQRASLAADGALGNLPVSASWGIAVFPHDGSDAESLTAAADRALYRAKADMLDACARTAERQSQDVFFAIGEAIGESLDPKQVVSNLCRAVATSLNLDACAIWLVRDNANVMPLAYHTTDMALVDRFAQAIQQQPITADEARATGLLRSQPVYVDDVNQSEVFPQRYRGLMAPGSWMLSVPLTASRRGMMLITARHERVSPPATGLALAVAQSASAALRNADLYQRARRQGEQLSELAGIGGLLFGDDDFEARLDAVVQRIVDVTGFEMVTIDTADPTGQQPFFRSFAGRGRDGGEFDEQTAGMWRSMRPALTEKAVSEFLATVTQPMVMDDPASQVPEFYRDAIVESGTRSVVVMPVNWQGELKGLFYFASYRSDAFDEQDIALMQTIASQLAPSIQVATLHVELADSYAELKDAHLQALLRLAYAAEARDPYTECHLQRIRAIAQAIGRRMGIEADQLEALGYGAIVHDLGKLRIPDSILINPGALSDDEWKQMKRHPEWGAEIIGDNAFYDLARQVALHHHERWDGSGYPAGLAGEQIPLAARIVSVADVYDALTSARPYKNAWPAERALVELMRMRGRTLCPASVDVFMELWREGEIARVDAETAEDTMEFDFRGLYAA